MELITAGDLMKRDLCALSPVDTVAKAIDLLHLRHLSGLPVVDEHWRLVGFFSQYDVIRQTMPTALDVLQTESFMFDEQRLLIQNFEQIKDDLVQDHMKTDPYYVEPLTHLMVVAQLLHRHRVRRLPVIENGLLVGMIEQDDFCDYLMKGPMVSS